MNLSAIAIGCVVFACVFGGALFGLFARRLVPEHHLSADSKDVVKLGIALIATMAALVLSLLIASAKSTYDTRSNQLLEISADIVLLDRELARYGPETKDARALLKHYVAVVIERFWPANPDRRGTIEPRAAIDARASPVEALFDKLQELSPQNETQRALHSQALMMARDLARTRVLLFEQLRSSIPVPFLVVLVFWLCIIFASFGLFAPTNTTVIATFFVCALSVSGAIFLILELDRSFEGFVQVSSAPLRAALVQLGH